MRQTIRFYSIYQGQTKAPRVLVAAGWDDAIRKVKRLQPDKLQVIRSGRALRPWY
jgi:hypothetical protein